MYRYKKLSRWREGRLDGDTNARCHRSDGKGWSQNLYAWYNGDLNDFGLTPAAAIDSWYNGEFSNYDAYGDKGLLDLQNHPDDWMPPPAVPDGDYMHFTALIWKVSESFCWNLRVPLHKEMIEFRHRN